MSATALTTQRTRRIYDGFKTSASRPDAIVLRNGTEPHIDLSFFYVSAIPSGIFEGSAAVLFPDGATHVLTSPLEEESARRAGTGFDLHVPHSMDESKQLLQEVVGKSVRSIGINSPELTHADYRRLRKSFPDARFQDVSPQIRRARLIKDDQEVAAIEEACRISSRVADQIPQVLQTGISEQEVAAEIDYRSQKAGGAGPSFTTISAFGKNAAEPHYTSLADSLEPDRFTLFDFGTRVRRYCSDITRTYFFGTPTPKDESMYATVAAAQQAALDMIGPGVKASDVHEAADDVIEATEFAGKFIHGLGHGLGLAVHDGGSVSTGSDLVLQPGMVVTVEPGIYLNGYGGVRIEDDVLITKNGYRLLTDANKTFDPVPA